jgi:hypothetical protein
MATTARRMIDLLSVKRIMNQRVLIPATSVGKRVRCLLQGDGNVVDVTTKDGSIVMSTAPGSEGIGLTKRIHNLRAVSQIALNNPRNRQYLKDGIAAEKAGDAKKADELLTEYLNATQVSFGIILGGNSIADKLHNGVEIAATVIKVDTENGSLLTIDPSTISVMEPDVLSAVNFDIDDFLSEDASDDTVPALPTKTAEKALQTRQSRAKNKA